MLPFWRAANEYWRLPVDIRLALSLRLPMRPSAVKGRPQEFNMTNHVDVINSKQNI